MHKDTLEEDQYKKPLEFEKLELNPLSVLKVSCPSCSTAVPADNLNIQNNVAKCSNCDVIFSFSEQVEQLSNQNVLTQEILQPEGVELSRFRDELDISVEQPWGDFEIVALSLFPLALLIIPPMMAKALEPTPFSKLAIGLVFALSLIAYIAYFFLRKKHKLFVHIDDRFLSIERRPKKLVKDKQFPIQDIDQVYIKSKTNANGQKGKKICMIVNTMEGQKHVDLVSFVHGSSKAKYIEQEIERHLKITDRRVPEEDG